MLEYAQLGEDPPSRGVVVSSSLTFDTNGVVSASFTNQQTMLSTSCGRRPGSRIREQRENIQLHIAAPAKHLQAIMML